jgi:predicted DNA-binding protein
MARKSKATPHLRVRIEPEVLERLEKSRKAGGRTLTGEIVDRIERSFRKEDDAALAVKVFRSIFGAPTGDLLRAFATAIWLIEQRTGKKWNQDRDTYLDVRTAIEAICEALQAPLSPSRAFELFVEQKVGSEDAVERLRKNIPEPDATELVKIFQKADRARVVALEALQKMGMAPPDAEIAEAGKEYANANPKDEGEQK